MSLRRIVLTAAALGVALWSGNARAGHLDKGLIGHGGQVIDALKGEHVKNVGVLPFKVKKGERQALYAGAPLSVNMPERLENALIMAMDPEEKPAVNVIRDAAGAASKAGVGSYLTSERAFNALFAQNYPLAWGQSRVKADGFLTGTVTNTGDRSKATVEIGLIKPGTFGKAPKTICKFDVSTDRQALADLGYNFSLSRSVLKRGYKRSDGDQQVQQQVKQEDQQGQKKPQTKQQTSQHSPDNVAGISYELRYNGEKQTITPLQGSQGASQSEWLAPPVKEGTKIEMVLTRKEAGEHKMGVLLLVNGRSSWKNESGDPLLNMKRWIRLGRHKDVPDLFEGRYEDLEGKNLLKWKALSAEESTKEKADELGNRAGWIDVYVFANKEGQPPTGTQQDEKDMFVTTRALPKARSATFRAARAELCRINNVKMKEVKGASGGFITKRGEGGLIDYEVEPVEGGKIGTDDFPNPELLGHLAIRYWEGEKDQKQGRIIERHQKAKK
ncbi:MAG: hypothetical protein U0797_14775 [Gemmataceae bacterium]